ncbi:MAG TPA: mechanosensitive ion channel domain-containing protein [Burkholderiaceae bacterium]|nr:mechanosensitive ion channel domain-containing protein [Burkholderiaceae bacterium]
MAATVAWGADAAQPAAGASPRVATDQLADPPATLRLLNREVVTLRVRIAGNTPQARVERAKERLKEMPPTAIRDPIQTVSVSLGDIKGVQFVLGDRLMFSLAEGDVDPEANQPFDALVSQTQARLEQVRTAWHETNDHRYLLQGAVRSGVATVLLAVLIWISYRASRVAVERMEKWRDRLAARFPYVDWREFLARLAVGSMQLVQWSVLLALIYWWAFFVLGSFAATAPIARSLGAWLREKIEWIADGTLHSLPGLATVAVVLLLTRAIVYVLGYFFEAVHQGRLRLSLFHPETVSATRRIFEVLIWGLGVAAAYPYLPGASSDAFKGVSVLIGLMITVGSAGLITQAMSGLVIVYSRSLRKGDFVDINGVQGVVTEVASLATKVVDVRNEEITIPNAVVIASPIRNYTKLGATQGTLLTTEVTIGYDTPWRQVHALLIGAARKTEGVRAAPEPYVFQRALSDFYVKYELFASIDQAAQRIPILSALHASILDEFNAHGVQIMSPHFLAQPDKPVVVPGDQWYAAPARRP